jgi:PhoPQ-activated pathogenicity-related protein
MRPVTAPKLIALISALLAAAPQPAPQRRTPETALDRYVAAPDASFAWKAVRELPAEGATATLLEMTSQKWLTENEVERPLWTHWLTVVRPRQVTSDIGFLFITGGSLGREPPPRPPAWMVDLARDTGTVVTELRLVPNQPIVFVDDPQRKPRTEDDYIAYTWDKFLRTGDEKWPARLPMTKSAVRAMDAITAFVASPAGSAAQVARFVVAGGSKRGWTTWTTAAVDARVVAIVPMVIDLLNIEPSFVHHWRAYGAWSDAVDDYVEHRIFDWMGTRQFRTLMKIEEPYEYRERLTLPKFLVNAAGDQFFLPDSSQFYFDDLRGEKQLRYVPNTAIRSIRPTRSRAFTRSMRRSSRALRVPACGGRSRATARSRSSPGSCRTRCASGRRPIRRLATSAMTSVARCTPASRCSPRDRTRGSPASRGLRRAGPLSSSR